MLALTHHLIVQYCAAMSFKRKDIFTDYGIIGDDFICSDDNVAQKYTVIMGQLGLTINMSKSLVSSELIEFAKR